MSEIKDSISLLKAVGIISAFGLIFGAFGIALSNPTPQSVEALITIIVVVGIIVGFSVLAWNKLIKAF